jgi:spermidine synthase
VLYFLILIEGYIGLALQMLFIRQLTSEVGSSSVTTSWIIGFFLLALSIGYKTGGIDQVNPIESLAKNFIKVGVLSGIGLSSVFIMSFFQMSSSFGTIVALIIYSTVIVSPIAYWMGQSLPLLIQKLRWGSSNSENSGNALFLSTIGSFLGAIVTTNVFLFLIGATWTLALMCIMSLTIGLYFIKSYNWKAFSIVGIITTLLINIGFSTMFGLTSSPYADIYVSEDKDVVRLIANNSVMSKLKNGENDTWYITQFNNFVKKENIKNKEFLILGAGGFVAHLEDQYNKYTYIDIDPVLKEISEKFFVKKEMNQEFIVSDARRYLIDTDKQHDLIFLDAFSSRHSVPAHLVTKEFFSLVRDRLKVDGKLVINVIMNPLLNSPYGKRFHSTLVTTFPFCTMKNNQVGVRNLANVMYFCEKKFEKIEIYSDDSNQNEFDYWQK